MSEGSVAFLILIGGGRTLVLVIRFVSFERRGSCSTERYSLDFFVLRVCLRG